MASLSLMVLEAQDHWKKNFAGFLADSLLERGEGGCFRAFFMGGLLLSCPEIFDQQGATQGGLAILGTSLIHYRRQECHLPHEIRGNGFRGRRG